MTELLHSFFPPTWRHPPPSCIAVSTERSKAEHFAGTTGFAVKPLLQKGPQAQTGGSGSSTDGTSSNGGGGGQCRMAHAQAAHPYSSAAAAAAGDADLIIFADALLDFRLLQVGWRGRQLLGDATLHFDRGLQTAGPPQAAGGVAPAFSAMPNSSPTHPPITSPTQAAHRHLKPGGILAALWTDRDLSSTFVMELEELLERAVPGGWAGLGHGSTRQAGGQRCQVGRPRRWGGDAAEA